MLRFKHWGLPCWSSGWESMLPMQGVRVWSLVGELRSRKLGGMARKEKKKTTLKLTYRNSLIKTKENSYGKKKDLNMEDSVLSSPSPRIIFLTKRLNIPLNSTLDFVLFLTFN